MVTKLSLRISGQGLHEVTEAVRGAVREHRRHASTRKLLVHVGV